MESAIVVVLVAVVIIVALKLLNLL